MKAAELVIDDENSLICPLCWLEVPVSQLTDEHIVPRAVGGTVTVPVCAKCNNDLGSQLDSHMAQHQKVVDAFSGHGTFSTRLSPGSGHITANLRWEKSGKHFSVVAKASDPAAVLRFRTGLESGSVQSFDTTIHFGFNELKFQSAVLKAAYLVLFKCFGYEYAKHEIVQEVRRMIADPALSQDIVPSLIIKLSDFLAPIDKQHLVAPGKMNSSEFFFVIIRMKNATTSYYGAFMPVPGANDREFFDTMSKFARENEKLNLTVPHEVIFW